MVSVLQPSGNASNQSIVYNITWSILAVSECVQRMSRPYRHKQITTTFPCMCLNVRCISCEYNSAYPNSPCDSTSLYGWIVPNYIYTCPHSRCTSGTRSQNEKRQFCRGALKCFLTSDHEQLDDFWSSDLLVNVSLSWLAIVFVTDIVSVKNKGRQVKK